MKLWYTEAMMLSFRKFHGRALRRWCGGVIALFVAALFVPQNSATAAVDVASALVSGLNWLIYYFGAALGLLGVAGSVLFVYVMDARVVSQILAAPIVDVTWLVVRDFFNLTFILILLFSAFATIFHIERFHLRNVLLRLIIMALLINFSLPIVKAVIDIANFIMYFFTSLLFPQTGTGYEAVEIFGRSINIMDIFVPQFEERSRAAESGITTYLIFAAIASFFYGISLITIAGLLVVRLIALVILMVLSPVGFVGTILPSTQGMASRYWQSLFKYAFMGPILVFTLFFATTFMAYNHDLAFSRDSDIRIVIPADTATNDARQTSNMANIAFLMVPIIIMWAGIIASNIVSDGASTMVTRFAGNAVRRAGAWARSGGRYLGIEAGRGLDAATGRYVTAARMRFNEMTESRTRRREDARRQRMERSYYQSEQRRNAAIARRFGSAVDEARKSLENFSEEQLRNAMHNGRDAERVAAARLLAENRQINDVDTYIAAQEAMAAAPEHLQQGLRDELRRTVRRNGRIDVVAAQRIRDGEDVQAVINSEFDISVSDLASQQSFEALEGHLEQLGRHIDSSILQSTSDSANFSKSASATVKREVAQISDQYRSDIANNMSQS